MLEGNAGEASGRVSFALQVRFSIAFQWRSYLESSREYVALKATILIFLREFLLFAVLFAMVAYAVLAIVFYNKDGGFQFVCVIDFHFFSVLFKNDRPGDDGTLRSV